MMKMYLKFLFFFIVSTSYGQQQSLTGTFSKSTSKCGCSTIGILKYTDQKGQATSTYLCFDAEPGDHYEIFPGETITVNGVFRSAICNDGKSYRNFDVSSSQLPNVNRQMTVPEFLKTASKN